MLVPITPPPTMRTSQDTAIAESLLSGTHDRSGSGCHHSGKAAGWAGGGAPSSGTPPPAPGPPPRAEVGEPPEGAGAGGGGELRAGKAQFAAPGAGESLEPAGRGGRCFRDPLGGGRIPFMPPPPPPGPGGPPAAPARRSLANL